MNSAPNSIFSKPHYTWLGAYWRGRKKLIPIEQWDREAIAFAKALRDESRGFIAVRFLQACGYTRKAATQIVENLDG